MLFVLGVIFIPRINLPYGASRLIMAILGAVYAPVSYTHLTLPTSDLV